MYLLAALLLTALAAAACAGGQEVPPPASVPAVDVEPVATAPPTQQPVEQTAVLEIRATDAPPEGVTKILITAGQIQVQQSGEDDESGWHTVVPGPVEFDLVAITGVEEVLGSRELAPGRYGQVRLDIQSVEVTMQDGAVLQARVPSRRLRVVGGFTLEAGQATVLTLDFDADKSVVIAGPRNVLLKPVLKLLVRDKDEALAEAREAGRTTEPEPDAETESEATPTRAAAQPDATDRAARTPTARPTAPPTRPAASPAPPAAAREATVEIRATDAPPEGVTKILITAGQIQVQQSGAADESGWHTVVPGPVEFDLVAITGVEEVLGSRELAPGRYGQIRLDIQSVEVTMEDGAVLQARVPSRRLKVVGGFTLEAGETTILTLDFDADKSVVIAGPRNVLLKPVVKLLVRDKDEARDAGRTTEPESEPEPEATATPTPAATDTPVATPTATPAPTATPVPELALVATVESEGGAYFAGAADEDLELIAIGGKVSTEAGAETDERDLTFFDADGNVLNTVDIGGGSWAVAMTPDGEKTVAGSDDNNLYVFEGTTLVASGTPVPANGEIRGVAIGDDGRYAGAGGFIFTLHDLTASDPITPIFEDSTTDQLRAVDISDDGRFVAYGGRFGGSNMYLGLFDTETMELVFSDTIEYSAETNAELRSLAISPDGSSIVAGDWAGFVHYYRRDDDQESWSRLESIEIGSRVYWIDMDASGTLAVVGVQGSGLRLYETGESALTLLWESSVGMDGGQRYVSITRNGDFITTGTRGGGGGGGQIFVFDRDGTVILSDRSEAVQVDDVYMASNGLSPEVWFTAVSEDGKRAVFASWGGFAYFYAR